MAGIRAGFSGLENGTVPPALRQAASQLQISLDDRALVPWLFQLGVMPSQSGYYALQLEPLEEKREKR